jgi:hypothetical protein
LGEAKLLSFLPGLFRELWPEIPVRSLLRLSDEFYGIRVYVPSAPESTAAPAGVLSPEEFAALCAAYPSTYITIPKACALRRELIRLEIMSRTAAGETRREVARHLRLSERTVYEVLARHRVGQDRRAARPAPSAQAKKRSKKR